MSVRQLKHLLDLALKLSPDVKKQMIENLRNEKMPDEFEQLLKWMD